jgi:hypothetical protein
MIIHAFHPISSLHFQFQYHHFTSSSSIITSIPVPISSLHFQFQYHHFTSRSNIITSHPVPISSLHFQFQYHHFTSSSNIITSHPVPISRNSQMFNSVMWTPHSEFQPNRSVTEDSAVINVFAPINIILLLLSRFSRNSRMFTSVIWRRLTELAQIGQYLRIVPL